jgi:hypothetical protein
MAGNVTGGVVERKESGDGKQDRRHGEDRHGSETGNQFLDEGKFFRAWSYLHSDLGVDSG